MSTKKIFELKDLNTDKEFYSDYSAVKRGDNIFTLKGRLTHGHDDSLPFVGVLYMNDKAVCDCGNDGWGGPTYAYAIDDELYKQAKQAIENCKLVFVKYNVGDNIHLGDIAEMLAINTLTQ